MTAADDEAHKAQRNTRSPAQGTPDYEPWVLDWVAYAGGTQVGPRATVQLSRRGESVEASGEGSGLIDAACRAISHACAVDGAVMGFRAYSLGPGSEAVGEVELDVEIARRRMTVRGSSTDVVEACARAYLAAINLSRQKS